MVLLKNVLDLNSLGFRKKNLHTQPQVFGVFLGERMGVSPKDYPTLIKLAKEEHQALLEEALQFVLAVKARTPMRLFMWKVTQLRKEREMAEISSTGQIAENVVK